MTDADEDFLSWPKTGPGPFWAVSHAAAFLYVSVWLSISRALVSHTPVVARSLTGGW